MFHFFVLFYGPIYPGPCRNCCGEEGLWGETVQPLGVGTGSPALVLRGHHLLSQVKVGLLCPWSHGAWLFQYPLPLSAEQQEGWSGRSSWRPSACLWGLGLTAKGSPMWRATRASRVLTDLREFGPSPLCVLGQLRAESWDSFRLLDHSWLNKTHVGICIFKRGASSTL